MPSYTHQSHQVSPLLRCKTKNRFLFKAQINQTRLDCTTILTSSKINIRKSYVWITISPKTRRQTLNLHRVKIGKWAILTKNKIRFTQKSKSKLNQSLLMSIRWNGNWPTRQIYRTSVRFRKPILIITSLTETGASFLLSTWLTYHPRTLTNKVSARLSSQSIFTRAHSRLLIFDSTNPNTNLRITAWNSTRILPSFWANILHKTTSLNLWISPTNVISKMVSTNRSGVFPNRQSLKMQSPTQMLIMLLPNFLRWMD